MCHNASAAKEDLHRVSTEEDLYFLAGKLVGNAVVMLLDVDVIVDMDGRPLEVDVPIPLGRQRLKVRPLQGREELPAVAVEFSELPCIQPLQKLPDPVVEFLDAEERVVSQGCGNPSGDH